MPEVFGDSSIPHRIKDRMTQAKSPFMSRERSSSREERSLESIDSQIIRAGHYLSHLDMMAEGLSISNKGKINYTDDHLSTGSRIPDSEYDQKFRSLVQIYDPVNIEFLNYMKRQYGVTDARIVNGCVVIAFDSSISTPDQVDIKAYFKTLGKAMVPFSDDWLGYTYIDINRQKNLDRQTNPTEVSRHEMYHYNLGISDFLLEHDSSYPIRSARRSSRKTKYFPNSLPEVAIRADWEYFEKLLGRDFNSRNDPENVLKQLAYLNEFHSSFLHRIPVWFDRDGKVYSVFEKNKRHEELVGNNPQDRNEATLMLGYVQGFRLLDRTCKSWQRKINLGKQLDEWQVKFVHDFPDLYREVGGLLGVSRTVLQAKRLIADRWHELFDKYSDVFQSHSFIHRIEGEIREGRTVNDIKSILFPPAQSEEVE